ncbi:MAG: hypothetical protein FJX57_01340 [Alphaproteobacteria bacterium]|nr:hypothetical protein [Alphaproteobacteria bacterium]
MGPGLTVRALAIAVLLGVVASGGAGASERQELCRKAIRAEKFIAEAIDDGKGGRIVLGLGAFDGGASSRLEKVVAESRRVDEIWLCSPGGRVVEGQRMGRFIRSRGLATRIPDGFKCISACVDAFVGGVIRFVDEERSIGIHMQSMSGHEELREKVSDAIAKEGDKATVAVIQAFEQSGAQGTAEWVRYMMQMGVSIRLVQLAVKVSHNDVHFLTWQDMRSFNVMNAN